MPTWTKEQSDAIYKDGCNIIVSAGAGSGKTAVLTARVIEKLKQGVHINELLILTFTKAAAGEMKERIRKNIKKYPDLTPELDLIDTAYITTFDSFALSVVKKYHYLVGITKNPKITDESMIEMLRKDTLRETLNSFYEKNDVKFENIIETFCVKDDDEIYNALLHMTKKLENNFTKKEFLQNYITNFFDENNLNQIVEEFESLVLRKRNDLKKALEEFSYIAPKDYLDKCYESISGILNSQTIDELILYRSAKLPILPRNSEEELKIAKEKVNSIIKELNDYLNYGSKETLLKDLQNLKPTIEVFISIIIAYFEQFENKKRKLEYNDFNDIAFLALKILKEFPNVREELKNTFHEIMIDEYQDTNNIQEEFIRLISKNNVYMVGDIKQSIYRFRNANPYIFKNKYDSYREHQNGEKIDLLKNFRSRKEVLQNINQMFNLIMDDFLGGANYIEEHQMIFGNNTYIEKGITKENYDMDILTYPIPKNYEFTKEEIEIFTIGRDIQNKVEQKYLLYDKDKEEIHPATYQDFVILIDRTTSFGLYKKIFNYLKIPITLYKDEPLNDSTILYIIKNILQVIFVFWKKDYSSKFSYAFTSVARSFVFEQSDELIYNTIKEKKWFQNPIYDFCQKIINQISYLSLSQLIDLIYKEVNIYEKIIKIGNIDENLIILEYIKTIATNYGKMGNSLEEFLEYLTRITAEDFNLKYSPNDETTNSVKIMTIHKSKGLEYPICYFAGLYKTFNISDIKERFLYDEKYGFLSPLYNEGYYTCFMKELIKDNYIREEISEKIRLFYVAVTRAKEKMILILPENPKDTETLNDSIRLKYRSFADFLYSIFPNIKKYQIKIDLDKLNLSKKYLTNRDTILDLKPIDKKIEVEELNIEYVKEQKKTFSKIKIDLKTKEEQKNMELGIKIHEYLEYLDFKNPNYNLIENDFFRKKVQKFIESDFIQKYKEEKIYKEYEFIYEEKNSEHHGIIDLLIETSNKILIVDYKLNDIVDTSYQKQLAGYKDYIARKTSKVVETYLYSILSEKIKKVD